MRRTIVFCLASILCAPIARATSEVLSPPPAPFAPGFDAISIENAREWLGYLAGPECAGRGTGEPGYQKAADYMAARFAAMGLKPCGDDGTYFQQVPFTRVHVIPDESFLATPGMFQTHAGAGISFSRPDGDFDFSGEVVFIQAQGADAKLPEDLNLEGKAVVFVGKDVPRRTMFSMSRGGVGVWFTVTDDASSQGPRLRPGGFSTGKANAPRSTIHRDAARGLARLLGVDPTMVDDPGADAPAMRSATGAGPISVRVRVRQEAVSVPNVVALLPGANPARAHEHIGVGAHLDHLGDHDGEIFYGADDDGSGSVAVLLVADALTKNPVKPDRSVLFMGFCGEEIGLIGSGYYTENPILPLSDMAALLQMDMVGRNEEGKDDVPEDNVDTIHLVGSKRISMELHEITLEANQHVGLVMEYDEEGVYRRSDHYNFAKKDVPITFLFSGFHPDYHKATDTIEKINFEKILRAARLNYLTAHRVAALDHMPAKDGDDMKKKEESATKPETATAGSE